MTLTPEQQRKKVHTLVVLLLFPFFMIAMAGGVYWMNVNGITLFAGESRARGELLDSPYPSLAGLATLQVIQGDQPIKPAGERSWGFLHVLEARCDDVCQARLWESRQTRMAMGRLSSRVQRSIIVLDTPPDEAFAALIQSEHPDLSVWVVSRGDWQQLMPADHLPAKLYFVDRFGNLIMRYNDSHTYKDIMKDMNFLIRHN